MTRSCLHRSSARNRRTPSRARLLVERLEDRLNPAPPVTPTVTLPFVDGAIIPFTNVQLETAPFSDPDGDFHKSTDWELFTVADGQRIWSFLGATGQERIHTDLSDGAFEGTHAGRTEAIPDTPYRLRVRHRDSSGEVSAPAERVFRTSVLTPGDPTQTWAVRQPGFVVEVVAGGFQLPSGMAFIPESRLGTGPSDPVFYVAELYGTIKVVLRDGSVHDYATNLLNFNPTGAFPGSGEQGIGSILVEPSTGDVIISVVYSQVDFVDSAPHLPRVLRLRSSDGGLTANRSLDTVLFEPARLPGFQVGLESQGQSHQISNVSIGPDGFLYVHNGEGFDVPRAQNLNSTGGKVLRMTVEPALDLTGDGVPDIAAPIAPDPKVPDSGNPFFDAADGITARDYVFALGFRNPFGGAWRASDGQHYTVENGPETNDRLSQLVRGRNYLWNGTAASMLNFAIYNWAPPQAPVNIAFVQQPTFGGSGFLPERFNNAYVTLSGPTYGLGPQANGKRIHEFTSDASGALVGPPRTLVEYVGNGRASAAGVAAGPDGLYFTDLYADITGFNPLLRGAQVLRVRFVGAADFTVDCDHAKRIARFTDRSSVPGAAGFLWDFGDGTTSTEQNPVHQFAAPGVYDVRLTVIGAGDVERVAVRRVFIGSQQVAGFTGQYFNGIIDLIKNPKPGTPALTRIDSFVNFDFGTGSPGAGVGVDNFTVRWRGQVTAPVAGTYTFTTRTDDGARLFVNGQLIINQWIDQGPTSHSGTFKLAAGQTADVEMHYYERGGGAVAQLFWTPPGQAQQVVPSSQTFEVELAAFRAEIFDNINFTGPRVVRFDPAINFNFAAGSPDPSIGPDTFSIRWTGNVVAPVTGTYTFRTFTDDGVRLTVNGQVLIDRLQDQVASFTATISLTAGQLLDIRMDYFENGGGAQAQLFWTVPGQAEQIVQAGRLCSVPLDPTPVPPFNLRVLANTLDRIDLAWNESSDVESFFQVERSADGVSFQVAGFAGPDATTFTDVPDFAGTYLYRVRAVTPFGNSAPSNAVTVVWRIPAAPTNLRVTRVGSSSIDLAWNDNSTFEDGFRIEWSTDGVSFSALATVGRDVATFTHADLAPGVYFYRLRAVNEFGSSALSNTVGVAVGPIVIDFSGGFASSAGLTNNGSAVFAENAARLTTGGLDQQGSVFANTRVSVRNFTTTFTFRIHGGTAPPADGFAFVIQGNGPDALARLGGGGLGYGPDNPNLAGDPRGIRNSIAIKFDIFNNGGEGINSTGIFTDGRSPSARRTGLPGSVPDRSVNLGGTGINLGSQHVFEVTMTYNGTTLLVTIRDAETGAAATQSYVVDIAALVGGDGTAFVGFTGGTGGLSAIQDIQSWVFASVFPLAPTNVHATTVTPEQIALAWNDNSDNEDGFIIERSTDGVSYTEIGRVGTDVTVFSDTALPEGTPFYRVRAFNALRDGLASDPFTTALNFSGGFAGATGLTTNGSASFTGGVARLTPALNSQAGSVFSSAQVSITGFTTSFTFRNHGGTAPRADGLTFTIQNAGPTALGEFGTGLGYGQENPASPTGIPRSVAIKFDLFQGTGDPSPSTTGLFTNGQLPGGGTDLLPFGIDFRTDRVFRVDMSYDGTTLTVIITDTETGATATQTYTVDIAAIVGGDTAYVGFTAGTGGLNANHDVQTWTFESQ